MSDSSCSDFEDTVSHNPLGHAPVRRMDTISSVVRTLQLQLQRVRGPARQLTISIHIGTRRRFTHGGQEFTVEFSQDATPVLAQTSAGLVRVMERPASLVSDCVQRQLGF